MKVKIVQSTIFAFFFLFMYSGYMSMMDAISTSSMAVGKCFLGLFMFWGANKMLRELKK